MSDELLKSILSELKELNRKVSILSKEDLGVGKQEVTVETKKELEIIDAKGFTEGDRHTIDIYYSNGAIAKERHDNAKDMLFRLEHLWSKIDPQQIMRLLDEE